MTRLWIVSAALAGAIALAVPAAAPDPTLAPGYRPAAETDEGGLWMAVEKAEADTQRSPLLVRDPALNAYVRQIVCSLAGEHCGSIRVYILEIPAFNASMYPNGMMHVFTGLLLRSENEAQLAFVLGHEIGHFLERHSLEQFRRVRNTGNFLAFFSLITAGAGVGFAGDLASLAAIGALFSYSRENEREADAHGFDAVVAHGYDTRQGAALWRALVAEEKANPKRKKKRSSFTATHPSPEERIETMTKRAEALQAEAGTGILNAEIFRDRTRPFRERWLEDELTRGEFEESEVVLNRLAEADPQSGELYYYLGELNRRQNDSAKLGTARQAYERALASAYRAPKVYRSLGLVAMKQGDKAAARQAFESYLAEAPSADDRQMIQYYLNQL